MKKPTSTSSPESEASPSLPFGGGYRTVCFVERDLYCQQVLRKNFPGVPICHDIHVCGKDSARWWDHKPIDLLTGGFPCQPVSCAGKRKGKEDDRWLWPEMLRVIKELRPRWVLGENVAGLIEMGLEGVLSDLEAEGYEVGTVVVPAAAVGAPHRRDRCWILAHSRHDKRSPEHWQQQSKRAKGVDRSGEDAPNSFQSRLEGHPRNGEDRDQSGWQREEANGPAGESRLCGDVANTNGPGSGSEDRDALHEGRAARQAGGAGLSKDAERKDGTSIGDDRPASEDVCNSEESAKRPGLCQEEQDWEWRRRSCDSDWWEFEPSVGRVAHGIPSRVDRLRALGNAIVPQVAYEIIKEMK